MRPINRREYGLGFNVSNSQIQGLTAKDRLLIRWRHARGSHPTIPCHRPLSSGAAQAFNVCLACGRELGFPLAADAARYELLSEPGAAPARIRPLSLSSETIALLRLRAQAQRLSLWGLLFCQVALLALAGAIVCRMLGAPEAGLACMVINDVAMAAWLIFFVRSARAWAAFKLARLRQLAAEGLKSAPILPSAELESETDPADAK